MFTALPPNSFASAKPALLAFFLGKIDCRTSTCDLNFAFVLLLFYTSFYVAVTWFIDYFYPFPANPKRFPLFLLDLEALRWKYAAAAAISAMLTCMRIYLLNKETL
ncbi:hypothetical protein [Paenibacillus sp. FSL L8-0463]|uniref:hypothetical protein n=1 Tax=Paenibacillus sp. FSL L8-0463 TaxID=2954687 RepID=UPI00311A4596